MAYNKKIWEDRVSENPTRRILTNVATGAEMVVDVARNEGEISQQGDAFDAATMNDLEDRIEEGLNSAAKLAQGTKAEIQAMIDQDLLEDGQQVIVTDDYVKGETIDELGDRVDALSENLTKLPKLRYKEISATTDANGYVNIDVFVMSARVLTSSVAGNFTCLVHGYKSNKKNDNNQLVVKYASNMNPVSNVSMTFGILFVE